MDAPRNGLTHEMPANERLQEKSPGDQWPPGPERLYNRVLQTDVGRIEGVVRAKRPQRVPVVLTREEVERLLKELDGVVLLVSALLFGSGMRLLECLHMRVKDIEFERGEITVRDGKGQKDRVTMLPASCKQALLDHLNHVRQIHEGDLANGLGQAPLPDALARKYPNADRQWGWQYVFPTSGHYTDRHSGIRHRHHLHESVIQKAMAEAVRRAGLTKRQKCERRGGPHPAKQKIVRCHASLHKRRRESIGFCVPDKNTRLVIGRLRRITRWIVERGIYSGVGW